MKLLTLALGALGLAGFAVGQELGSTTYLTTATCAGDCPGHTVTRPPAQIAVSTTACHNAITTKFPRCKFSGSHYICPTPVIHDCGETTITAAPVSIPYTTYQTCDEAYTETNSDGQHDFCRTTTGYCGGESTISTLTWIFTECPGWESTLTKCPPRYKTVTTCFSSGFTFDPVSTQDLGGGRTNRFVKKYAGATTSEVKPTSTLCLGPNCPCVGPKCPGWSHFLPTSTATPAPTHCPPSTCGPAYRPDPHCRKDVKFGRDASPTSNDSGGRSQHRVAREASATNDFSILPISTPTQTSVCPPGWIGPDCNPFVTTTTVPCPKCPDGMPTTRTPKVERDVSPTCFPGATYTYCSDFEHTSPYHPGLPGCTQAPSPPIVEREAVYTSNDMGGRSQYGQRGVAREASPTWPKPCEHSGGVYFTGNPARPTKDLSISMPTKVEMHTMVTVMRKA
jgi:hypothetical protein